MKMESDEETIKNLRGGSINLTPKVKSHIKRLEENTKIESPIFFTSKKSEDENLEPGATKYYLEEIGLRENDELVDYLPLQLIKSLDKRINDGLLLILVSEDESDILSRRIILWYLPLVNGAFQLFQNDNQYSIDLISEIFIDTGNKFKTALFEGNMGSKFEQGKVSDKSLSGSRYWIETFLGASFELESPQIQNQIAKSLKKISAKPIEPKNINQRDENGLNMVEDDWEPAFDFNATLESIDKLDDDEEITIDRIVEEFVPKEQKSSFNRSFPEEVRAVPFQAKSTKETFQQQFRRKKIRAILSDNSVIEIIGTREDIEKHLKRDTSNGKVTFTLEATETIEDLMR